MKDNKNAEGRLFKEYFDSIFGHSNIFSKKEYEEHFLDYEINYERFLPEDKNAKILDIGCGTGHFLYFLNKKSYKNFQGIDIAPQQIDFCRKNISQHAEIADAFEFLTDKTDLYDTITASDLLEHIPKNRTIEFLILVNKALKDKGIFIMKTPNLGNPFAIRLRYVDFTHEVGFTEKSLYQVFWSAGFRNIQILPLQQRSFTRKGLVSIIHFFLRKLFWYQGFVAPKILSPLLVGVAKNEKL